MSIVQSIVSIATDEATSAAGQCIDEIELDIGSLSGIEMDSFWFAWQLAIKDTMLEKAKPVVNNISGKAKCLLCDTEFGISHYSDPCPQCNSHFIDIIQGRELKVKAITIS